MKNVEFYHNKADSVVVAVLSGGNAQNKLASNGEVLDHLYAGAVDAAVEKHVPVLQKIDNILEVTVGSVFHPMEENHYIVWIALVTDNNIEIKYLKPGQPPKAVFEAGDHGVVYAYCNLHGLWKEEFSLGDVGEFQEVVCSPESGCILQDT